MSTNARDTQNSTGVRPSYFYIGTDGRGRSHYYDTRNEHVHVATACERVRRVAIEPGTERDLDAYVAAVRDARGWAELRYGTGLVEAIASAVEV